MAKIKYLLCLILLSVILSVNSKVLLVSFDGIRANIFDEYLKNNSNSSFKQFIENGIKARYMVPSFPTLTFPNHISIVTGLLSSFIFYYLFSKLKI